MTTEAAQRTTLLNDNPDHRNFQGHAKNVVTVIRLDAENVYSADDEGYIHIYGTATGRLKKRLDVHRSGYLGKQYYHHVLVSGSTDTTMRIWDLQALRQAYAFQWHTGTVRVLEAVEPVLLNLSTGDHTPPFPVIVLASRDATNALGNYPESTPCR